MTSTSTTTNEHYDKAREILTTAPRYRLDGPGDPHMPGLAIDTLEHHIREMAAQADRWKRLALAYESHEDALLYGSAEDQENAREEARVARDALITSGDLPADRMSQTSRTSTNEHADAIHEILECLVTSDGSVYRITDAQADQIESHAAAMAQQLADVQEVCRNLSEAEREYEAERGAMAARIEERESQLRLIAPVVSAALEMFQWEGSTDYPDGDPEVIKRRRAFRDALYHLDDLHYDEFDFLDDFQPGDLPPAEGSNGR